MRRRGGAPEAVALRTCWRRWVSVVELFARRRPARRRVDPKTYGILHKELIQKCRSLAASADEVESVFYRYLEDLAQPWLTPAILARADREILTDLLVRCRQAENQLGGRTWAQSVLRVVIPLLLVSFFVFVGLVGLGIADQAGFPILNWLRSWSDDVWFAVKRSSDVERLSVAGFVLIVISIFAVMRTARS
jgi:hypothetical protein